TPAGRRSGRSGPNTALRVRPRQTAERTRAMRPQGGRSRFRSEPFARRGTQDVQVLATSWGAPEAPAVLAGLFNRREPDIEIGNKARKPAAPWRTARSDVRYLHSPPGATNRIGRG